MGVNILGVRVKILFDLVLVYWVSAAPRVQQQLEDAYVALHHQPYMPIFVKFRGAGWAEKLDGFASKYNRLMRVQDVSFVQASSPDVCK